MTFPYKSRLVFAFLLLFYIIIQTSKSYPYNWNELKIWTQTLLFADALFITETFVSKNINVSL